MEGDILYHSGVVLLFITVLRLVCSHYLCGGSWTSSGEGGVPEKEVLRFTEGERNNSVDLSCDYICAAPTKK